MKNSSDEESESALARIIYDPLDYLLVIMNDVNYDLHCRIKAASALMPYFHLPQSERVDDD